MSTWNQAGERNLIFIGIFSFFYLHEMLVIISIYQRDIERPKLQLVINLFESALSWIFQYRIIIFLYRVCLLKHGLTRAIMYRIHISRGGVLWKNPWLTSGRVCIRCGSDCWTPFARGHAPSFRNETRALDFLFTDHTA